MRPTLQRLAAAALAVWLLVPAAWSADPLRGTGDLKGAEEVLRELLEVRLRRNGPRARATGEALQNGQSLRFMPDSD